MGETVIEPLQTHFMPLASLDMYKKGQENYLAPSLQALRLGMIR
jgi:hypothetical protein